MGMSISGDKRIEQDCHQRLSISRAIRPAGVSRLGALRRRQARPVTRALRALTSTVRQSERAYPVRGP